MKVRFAPSPTGYIHVGNCRTALVNWLLARKHGGTFLLRLDDTDLDRCKDEYIDALHKDWAWLGLDYDDYAKQSDRMALYHAAVEKLKKAGRLYACYETPEELEYKRKLRLKQGLPPIYDREGLHLTDAQKAQFEQEGRKPHWRFLLKDSPVEWDDIVRGPTHFEGSNLSDPILIRESGTFVYILASVVDDIDLNITHIVRGEDHVSNTAIQLQLVEALGADPKQFQFAHLALLAGEQGEALGKRLGSLGIQDLRDQGILPMAICSLLGKIGTSDAIQPYTKMDDLITSFDLTHFSRATAKFSITTLQQLNKKILQDLSFEEVKPYSPVPEMDEPFWKAVQHNIDTLNDIKTWWETCHQKGDGRIAAEDRDFIQKALDLLPEGPWTENPWDDWMKALKDQTQRKGKSLFMPLRLALTGQEHGPELKVIIHLLGHTLVNEKLRQGLECNANDL
jgi:glutamyl-tRNA synthetase